MGSKCGKKPCHQPALNASRMEHAKEAYDKNEERKEEFERWLRGWSNLCRMDRTRDKDGYYTDRTVALMFRAFKARK